MLTYDRPPVVLVDMDGVLTDIETGFWQTWEHTVPTGPRRETARRHEFYIEDQLTPEWTPAVRDVVNTPGFFATLPVVAGAASAMNAMLEAGWDVRVCTAPLLSNPTCASDKLTWLEEHIGAGWARRTVISKDKSFVRGDLLIDDKPHIEVSLTPTWKHVVFDATYNATADSPLRMTDWDRWAATLTPLLGRTAA